MDIYEREIERKESVCLKPPKGGMEGAFGG